ncbi:MAG: DUF1648 domain-containing protein [Phaeodactylibacter sp.]|uniref:DUF1648 domain-containing protein n=1 Tax=Phaeodactylibacter sp. TaxID=1940289 RepID=UPI0032EE74BF
MNRQLIFILDLLSLSCIASMLATGLFYYGVLPDQIPVHFNASGQADDYGPKAMIFLLPIIAIAVSVLVWLIGREPQNYNFPIQITDHNREALTGQARLFVSATILATHALLAYIYWGILQAGFGHQNNLNPGAIWLYLGILSILFVHSYYRMKRRA